MKALEKGKRKKVSYEQRTAILHDVEMQGEKVNLIQLSQRHKIQIIEIAKIIADARHRRIRADRREMLDRIVPLAWKGLETGLNRLVTRDKLGAKLTKEARATLVAGGELTGESGQAKNQPMFQIEGGAQVVVNVHRDEKKGESSESLHFEVSEGAISDDGGDSGDEPGESEPDR